MWNDILQIFFGFWWLPIHSDEQKTINKMAYMTYMILLHFHKLNRLPWQLRLYLAWHSHIMITKTLSMEDKRIESAARWYCNSLTGIRLWISHQINWFVWDIITHPWLNFNGGLSKPPLKLRHGWIIISHCFTWMKLATHPDACHLISVCKAVMMIQLCLFQGSVSQRLMNGLNMVMTCPCVCSHCNQHYIDVIMTTMASQITSLTVVYSTVHSDADQRKHQSSASLAFVWGIHRDRWIPRTKGQLRGKCFHLMTSSWFTHTCILVAFVRQWCDIGSSPWIDTRFQTMHPFPIHALRSHCSLWYLLGILLWTSEPMG